MGSSRLDVAVLSVSTKQPQMTVRVGWFWKVNRSYLSYMPDGPSTVLIGHVRLSVLLFAALFQIDPKPLRHSI